MHAQSVETIDEYVEAVRAYEQQLAGRGARFTFEVEATLERIREHPLSFPRVPFIKRPTLRKAKVLRFPYSIIYYVQRGTPIIVAVAHGKKVSAYWGKRLR